MPTGPVLNGSGWPLRTVLSCSVGGVRDAVKKAEGVCKNKSSCAIGDRAVVNNRSSSAGGIQWMLFEPEQQYAYQWRIHDLKKGGAPGVLGACPQDFFVNISQFMGLFASPPPPLDPPLPTQGSAQLLNKRSSGDKGAIVTSIVHVLQRLFTVLKGSV